MLWSRLQYWSQYISSLILSTLTAAVVVVAVADNTITHMENYTA
jgi:hypothetical protein